MRVRRSRGPWRQRRHASRRGRAIAARRGSSDGRYDTSQPACRHEPARASTCGLRVAFPKRPTKGAWGRERGYGRSQNWQATIGRCSNSLASAERLPTLFLPHCGPSGRPARKLKSCRRAGHFRGQMKTKLTRSPEASAAKNTAIVLSALAALVISVPQCAATGPEPIGSGSRALVVEPSRKICQLTGTADRGYPHRPTGAELGGGNSTVEGTDLGFAFEQGNELRFFFGDSHEFAPDVCEPSVCGTLEFPLHAPLLPSPNAEARVIRAPSQAAWDHHIAVRGDGAESMARASIDNDPKNCIGLKFDTDGRGPVLGYELREDLLRRPIAIGGSPVATHASDRFVAAVGSALIVVVASGQAWRHAFDGLSVSTPYQLQGVAHQTGELPRAVFGHDDDLIVVSTAGTVSARRVDSVKIGQARSIGTVDLSMTRWIAATASALVRVDSNGKAYLQQFSGDALLAPEELSPDVDTSTSPPTVAHVGTDAQDRFVIGFGDDLLVADASGDVYRHKIDVGDRRIRLAQRVSGDTAARNRVALAPEVGLVQYTKHLFSFGERIYSISPKENGFRKTTLDGKVIGRREGFVSGLADEHNDVIGFATTRHIVPGCDGECAHDDTCYNPAGCQIVDPILGVRKPDQSCPAPGEAFTYGTIAAGAPVPGGKSVIAVASGANSSDFVGRSVMSTAKFLWPIPQQIDGNAVAGLPSEVQGHSALLVWGTGRSGNYGLNSSPWNSSPPYLAVATMDQARARGGAVFAHSLAGNVVRPPVGLVGAPVAAFPEDRRVFAVGDHLFVTTSDGRVFRHTLSANRLEVSAATRLLQSSCGLVGALPQDKWVFGSERAIFVVTSDGRVFAHDLTGDTVSNAYAFSGPAVGARPEDRWVFLLGSRFVVVTNSGTAFAHDIDSMAKTVGPGYALTQVPEALVGARPGDKLVAATGSRLLVVRDSGDVWWHDVSPSSVGPAYAMGMNVGAAVGARDEDKFIVPSSSPLCALISQGPNCNDNLLVITRPKWKYYAGENLLGGPTWSTEESAAVALAPFGNSSLDTLGYFSVRYYDELAKWIMMWTSSGGGERIPRGVYVSTASTPWGPWSAPQRTLDEATAYCNFMYHAGAELDPSVCPDGSNPSEEGRRGRDGIPQQRSWGGAYAPYLLPSRYATRQGNTLSFYYTLSVWNPYQVMLMRAELSDTF